MSDLYNTRIKLKRDTEANWLSADPVLLDGEVAIVKCDNGVVRKKIGDGTKKFSELSYDGIQSDWSQNDPNGDGYVANRPGGYLTDPIVTDADAFTIASTEDGDGTYYGAVVAVGSSAITPSDYAIGDGVVVVFGGKSYNLTWRMEEGFPVCGAAVTGEAPDWSSAPFCIIAVFGENGSLQAYYVYLQNAVTSPIQVKLKMAKQTPVRIPMKYLESDVYIVKVTSKSNEQRPGIDGSDVSMT